LREHEIGVFGFLLAVIGPVGLCCAAAPPRTDYCKMLGRNIAGKQHGFLAGNHLYYVGGASDTKWRTREHETIGFTHPMFRDGRARGYGIVTGRGGTGHDKWGWEFWRQVRAAYGTVTVNGKRFVHPKPAKMIWRPDRQICTYKVGGATIEETKFISTDDVLCAIITSDRPVALSFEGHSFIVARSIGTHDGDPPRTRFSRTSTARGRYDRGANAIHITEGGTIMTKPAWKTPAVVGKLMYDGMSTVISASRNFADSHTIKKDKDGRQRYTLEVNCEPGKPLVLAMAMGDKYAPTARRVRKLFADPGAALADKTKYMNGLLNTQIPYFRCSDANAVKVYYYLWSLYFMYFTHTGKGWEQYPHTQTAINNFMGLHLWDSWAFTATGAWVADKWAYGHGNVLSWKFMVPFKNKANAMPDNFGIAWYSPGVWMNFVGATEFAWRQYEQSGDRAKEFLKEVYDDLFRKLYWTGPQRSFGIEINALDALAKMAAALGRDEDVKHWRSMRPRAVAGFKRGWRPSVDYYGSGRRKDIWQLASMMCNEMPDEWAAKMVRRHVMDTEDGFIGPVPLDVRPPTSPENGVFAVSTISTWLAVEGMFRRGCDAEAVYCTLGHLRGMVRDHGFPVAPECWDPGYKPWGSMYYNWDCAMVPLLLERLAGVSYSIPDSSFTVSDHLPDAWRYVETRSPVVAGGKRVWVRVRIDRAASREGAVKKITIEGCPLKTLIVEPWLEDRKLLSAAPAASGQAKGHATFRFSGASDRTVSLKLGRRTRVFNTLAYLTPHSGEFKDSIEVKVTNLLPGTTLRYTTDGRDPTPQSPICKAPLTFTRTTTLKIRAFSDSDDGTIYLPMTAKYTFVVTP